MKNIFFAKKNIDLRILKTYLQLFMINFQNIDIFFT